MSVKTAERGGSFQVQAALARGWSEQRLHTGGRRERKALAGVPGAGSVGATGGGVTHLTTISGCSFHLRVGCSSCMACGGRGSHRDILPRASKGTAAAAADADRDTNRLPKRAVVVTRPLPPPGSASTWHLLSIPSYRPGHPAPGSRDGRRELGRGRRPSPRPRPSRQTAPNALGEALRIPREAVPAWAAGLVTSQGTFRPETLPTAAAGNRRNRQPRPQTSHTIPALSTDSQGSGLGGTVGGLAPARTGSPWPCRVPFWRARRPGLEARG